MKFLFNIPDTALWLAEKERRIIGCRGSFIDPAGNRYEYQPHFIPAPGSIEDEELREHEEEASRQQHIDSICQGSEPFTDCEIKWEIDHGFGHFGFKNAKGDVIIEPQFAWVGAFSHGLCPVNLNRTWYRTPEGLRYYENHYGYIDIYGKTVIPFCFEDAQSFNKYGVAAVTDRSGSYMIDTAGNEIPGTWFPYIEGRIDYNDRYIEFSDSHDWLHDENENRNGLYDTKERRILCQPVYGSFTVYDEDTICIVNNNQELAGPRTSWLINSRGQVKHPWQLTKGMASVEPPDENGCSVVGTVIKPGHHERRIFQYGIMDGRGQFLVKTNYDRIVYLGRGLYACEKNGSTDLYEMPLTGKLLEKC